MYYKLSLAIPTYNRVASISKRLAEFHEFSNVIQELWVSDNSSNSDIEDLIASDSDQNVLYVRNKYNIGGGANFISSLLLGDSDYIWLRGDDDPVTNEQVNAVVSSLSYSPDIIILSPNAKSIKSIRSISDFFQNFNECQSAGWLSMLVFKQQSLGFGLKWGYWGIKSGWANITLVLGILRDKPQPLCLIVPITLRQGDFREDGRKSRAWSVLKTCVDVFPSVFDLIPSRQDHRLAWFRWRQSHTFNLSRTFLRSRLGLAPREVLSLSTFANLLSLSNPKSTLIALSLLVIQIFPRNVLALFFAILFMNLSSAKLEELELSDLIELSILGKYRFIRNMQSNQFLAQSFL